MFSLVHFCKTCQIPSAVLCVFKLFVVLFGNIWFRLETYLDLQNQTTSSYCWYCVYKYIQYLDLQTSAGRHRSFVCCMVISFKRGRLWPSLWPHGRHHQSLRIRWTHTAATVAWKVQEYLLPIQSTELPSWANRCAYLREGSTLTCWANRGSKVPSWKSWTILAKLPTVWSLYVVII